MAANLRALEVLRALQAEQRAATGDEQRELARWSSWGAVPEIFDEHRAEWAPERGRLRELLDDQAYAEARRTTINAHYTDPAYVGAIWTALGELGFDGGRVLEPGAGAGTFIGMAPASADMVGVELDPTTAAIAARAVSRRDDPDGVLRRYAVPGRLLRRGRRQRAVRRRAAARPAPQPRQPLAA